MEQDFFCGNCFKKEIARLIVYLIDNVVYAKEAVDYVSKTV